MLISACCNNLSQSWIWNYLSTLHIPNMKLLLKFLSLSLYFSLWLLGGTSWYLMFMEVIVIFKAVDASLSTKWNMVWSRNFLSLQFILWRIVSFPCYSYSSFLWLGWHFNHMYTWRRSFFSPTWIGGEPSAYIWLFYPFFSCSKVYSCAKHYIFVDIVLQFCTRRFFFGWL